MITEDHINAGLFRAVIGVLHSQEIPPFMSTFILFVNLFLKRDTKIHST